MQIMLIINFVGAKIFQRGSTISRKSGPGGPIFLGGSKYIVTTLLECIDYSKCDGKKYVYLFIGTR